jgi:hypothetical protein
VEAGNVSIDNADVEFSDAVRLCDEGLLDEIDLSILLAAPDGTSAEDDFTQVALQDCAVANIVWSTVMAPHMRTAAANLGNAWVNNFEFWVDKDADLNELFNAWLTN